MGFQINSEEFEVAEDNKKTDINFEIADVIRQIEFLKERYQERIKAVQRRKENLLRTVKVFVITAIALIFLTVLLLIMTSGGEGQVFAIWAEILFVGISVVIIINAARAMYSYCIHNGMVPSTTVYTLKMEEQDLRHFKKRLEDAEERLKHFLEQGKRDEEAGRLLLDEVLPQLQEEERRADHLYGESVRA